MPGILLVIAGLLEVAWAAMLPVTEGLSRPLPTVGFVTLLAGSMFLLARATETIPIGTAYVVWVGIGAVGAATVGMLQGDPVTAARILCLLLIVTGVIGLNLTGGH